MNTFAPSLPGRHFTPSQAETSRLREQHHLTYHISYCALADQYLHFADKRVLEVGGSLPPGFVNECLGVSSWAAVEELGYWQTVDKVEHHGEDRLYRPPTLKLEAAQARDLDSAYVVLDGAIEDAPDTIAGQFDVAFSIACFEHISRLPKALAAVHRLLKPGGRLFTMFSPIWSAYDGHPLPGITDAAGRKFTFAHSPIPPWGHLMATPSELYRYLLDHTDATAAEEIVYYVYHAPHINRLFAEDYVRYFRMSPFHVSICQPSFARPIAAEAQSELERRHPGRRLFSNNGFIALLEKAA
jgi:SAM-dependent methyltransferase